MGPFRVNKDCEDCAGLGCSDVFGCDDPLDFDTRCLGCGDALEVMSCLVCDGLGALDNGREPCEECGGTGFDALLS